MNKNLTPEQKKAIELYEVTKLAYQSSEREKHSSTVDKRYMLKQHFKLLEEIFGKELFEEQIDIRERVKTWEDACTQLKGTEFLKKCNNSICDIISCLGDSKNKHLKSVLAYCKLLVIVEALNEGANVGNFNRKAYVYYDFAANEFTFSSTYGFAINALMLNSDELAQHLIDNFSDLLKDYFMID